MELNCIRLLVTNFDECFKFYQDSLGFKCTWGEIGGEYALFEIGSALSISLYKKELMAKALDTMNLPVLNDGQDSYALIIKTNCVDKAFNDYKNKNVVFLNEPKDMPGWGMRVVHLRDPEGNLIELWSELLEEKWEKDLVEKTKEYDSHNE